MKSLQSKHKQQCEKVIEVHSEEEKEDDIEEEDDDQINEQLFSMYDDLFQKFNGFGATFQQTANHIGLLIRKNMTLNQNIDHLQDEVDKWQQKAKMNEEAYENILKQLNEKDKIIEDLMSENASLKLQFDQFLKKPNPQQRDILKEREESTSKRKESKSNFNQQKANIQQNNNNQLIPGTYETFFDLEKPGPSNQGDNENCSLKDLFSLKNTKKRGVREIEDANSKDKWITNKKRNRKSYIEDSQIAEKFNQLSQAFFQSGNQNSNNINESLKLISQGRESLDTINAQIQKDEDSASSTSLINAGIRFDAQQAKDNMRQTKLNFKQEQEQKKKQQKKFELQVVEQVSDSLQEDFFSVKNLKKDKNYDRVSSNSNARTSSSNKQKSGKMKQKMY